MKKIHISSYAYFCDWCLVNMTTLWTSDVEYYETQQFMVACLPILGLVISFFMHVHSFLLSLVFICNWQLLYSFA